MSNERVGVLPMWTIFERPKDYPDYFVVRRFDVTKAGPAPTNDVQLAPTLDEARALLPDGLYCIGREPDDDAVIVETWV